ncbi:YsnF/AvaK domain-containing protein, partial [Kitasatospora sp. NPDC057198]|uniref:YsnF/AvaK domain-containing protein n=1 Tax=Kitasatospora sp. NPDC057198 TaxID=3346046 RepID=UPI00363C6C5D
YRYYGLDAGGDVGSGPTAPTAKAAEAGAAGAAGAADAGAKEHQRQEPAVDRDFGTLASSPTPAPAPAPAAAAAAPAAFTTAKAAPAPARQDDQQQSPAQPQTQPHQAQAHSQAQSQSQSQAQSQSQSQSQSQASPTAPVEITCREERIDISTEWHEVGTTRLRKYVTTEQVERRVPVVRERVRVERIPVSDAERAALSEQEIAEAVEEVTLREERPVVRKYLAPIERVRLVVERYTEEEVVREELRREQVEVHDATTGGGEGEAPQQRQPWNAQPQSPTAARPQSAAANGGPEHARPEPLRS